MNDLTFVCPPDRAIIANIKDRRIVVVVDAVKDIQAAIDLMCELVPINPMHALWVNDHNATIAEINPEDHWKQFHISLYARSMGDKLAFLRKMNSFTALNIRFFLPVGDKDNIVSLQFITSLGFHSGIIFEKNIDAVNAEMLTDLCYYNKYMKACSGTIEPFNHIKGYYIDKSGFNLICDIGEVYYASPSKFVHVDQSGMLSLNDMFGQKKALNISIEHWPEIFENEIYKSALDESKQHFLKQTRCSKCSTWRVCQGKFVKSEMFNYCEDFFSNILYA